MDKIVTENLFLLEFLVDRVQLDPDLSEDITDVTGDTCVSVQFLDNAALDICEDDFTPKRTYKKENDNLKSGKSCLFSLTPEQAEEAVKQFDIYVNIYKKMQPGVLPDKIQVGNSLVSIVNLFNDLVDSIVAPVAGQSPTAKTLKDTFKVTNVSGEAIGDISMYIRMSCFGKLIVTQFQMNLDDKSVLFKDKEGHSLYRYKKAGSKSGGDGTCVTSCPSVPCPTTSSDQKEAACNECSMTTQENDSLGCYKEIGAEVGGNSLIIRILKPKKNPDEAEDCCECSPGNMGNKKKPKLSAISNDAPMSGISSMQPGGCGQPTPFSIKMGASEATQNNLTVYPPPCSGDASAPCAEEEDPDHDVFVLRIGKKSEGCDKQGELEVEVRTPKGPPLKQLPKKNEVETQCEEMAVEPKGGKGGKKGGKKK